MFHEKSTLEKTTVFPFYYLTPYSAAMQEFVETYGLLLLLLSGDLFSLDLVDLS